MGNTKRTTLDAFKGTRTELLALLRDLHNGAREVDGLSRLEALDVVCETLASPDCSRADASLAVRVVGSLARAVGGVS
mgnify:FL=1